MVQPTKQNEGREARTAEVAVLKETFLKVSGGVVADYRGLTVEQMTKLRRKFHEQGVRFQVVKNTLTRIAVDGTDYKTLDAILAGPTGVAFGSTDALAPARVAVEFSKETDKFQIKGGFLDGKVLSKAEVVELSKLPGKNELRAQLLSAINGPAQSLLGVLNGVPQKLLGVLDAQAQKLGSA